MDEKELYEWLDTCPTHHWEETYSDENGVTVNFRITRNNEEDESCS